MPDKPADDFSFNDLFAPLTTRKILVFLTIIAVIIYFSALFNPFIYDDISSIVLYPFLRKFSYIPFQFINAISYPGTAGLKFLHLFYRPLLFAIYNFLYVSFGPAPFPFHLLQLILHIANSFMVYLIISHNIPRKIAFVLTLIFLTHPLNSETVVYIGDMQDSLFLFFGLLAFVYLLRHQHKTLSLKQAIIPALFFILSLLSKESGILMIIINFIFIIWFSRNNLKNLLITTSAGLGIYTIMRVIASFYSNMSIMPSPIQRSALIIRLITIPKILLYYISKLFIPVNFAIGQEWLVRKITFADFLLPLMIGLTSLLIIILAGRLVYQRKKQIFPVYLFFGLWFTIGLGAVSQLIPLDLTVADRWFYLPFIGLLGMIGIFISTLKFQLPKIFISVFNTAIALIILCLSILTMIRNSQWQSTYQLYSHDLQYAIESPELENFLGEELVNQGQFQQAKVHFQNAVRQNPLGDTLNALGYLAEQDKNYLLAEKYYSDNIKLQNNLPKYISYEGLARIALVYEHQPEQAISISEEALQKYPNDETLIKLSAYAQYVTGNNLAAAEAIKRLLSLDPSGENKALYNQLQNKTLIIPGYEDYRAIEQLSN